MNNTANFFTPENGPGGGMPPLNRKGGFGNSKIIIFLNFFKFFLRWSCFELYAEDF